MSQTSKRNPSGFKINKILLLFLFSRVLEREELIKLRLYTQSFFFQHFQITCFCKVKIKLMFQDIFNESHENIKTNLALAKHSIQRVSLLLIILILKGRSGRYINLVHNMIFNVFFVFLMSIDHTWAFKSWEFKMGLMCNESKKNLERLNPCFFYLIQEGLAWAYVVFNSF